MKKTGIVLLVMVLLCGVAGSHAWAARAGGTLNFMAPYGGDLFGLDPHRSTRTQDFLVAMNIHRCLYQWDPEKSMPVLDLAESVQISDDGLVYTFKLRPNIKFHNGRQMTVDDVIWSYNRMASMKPACPSTQYIRPIKGVEAVEQGKAEKIAGLKQIDDLTLEMTLEDPVDIKHSLRYPGTAIVPKEEVERLGDGFATHPVGCGPFKFVQWVKGSEVVLEKFPDFYLRAAPISTRWSTRSWARPPPGIWPSRPRNWTPPSWGRQLPEYQADPVISKNMIEVAELFTRHVGMNPDFKPFSDKRVRQAINYAIDWPT